MLVWKKIGCSFSINVVYIPVRNTATFFGMCGFLTLDKFVSAGHAVTVNL